jgi:hypothetical protein
MPSPSICSPIIVCISPQRWLNFIGQKKAPPLIRWPSLEKQIRGTEIKAQVQTVQYFNKMSQGQNLSSTSGKIEFEIPTSQEKNKHGFLLNSFVLN